MTATDADAEKRPVCYVCHEGEEHGPLLAPCRCHAPIHLHCQRDAIAAMVAPRCSICKAQFRNVSTHPYWANDFWVGRAAPVLLLNIAITVGVVLLIVGAGDKYNGVALSFQLMCLVLLVTSWALTSVIAARPLLGPPDAVTAAVFVRCFPNG